MGIDRGESLRAWRDYFTQATIVGFDNAESTLVSEPPRIESVLGSQGCHIDLVGSQCCHNSLAMFPQSRGIQFDVIIDDCSHHLDHQVMSVFWLWPYLRAGGLYVIEDVTRPEALHHFTCFAGKVDLHDLRAVKGRHDDIAIVIHKPTVAT